MADKGTEQATPLRKQKAREKGDRVHSRELLSAVAILGGIVLLGAVTRSFVTSWSHVYTECIRLAIFTVNNPHGNGRQQLAQALVSRMLAPIVMPIVLVMAASFGGALLVGIAQGGGLRIYPNALALKFTKLSPVANMVTLFSLRSVTRLAKSLVPAAVMVVLGFSSLRALVVQIPVMSMVRLPQTFSSAYGLALDAAWVMLAWSGLDYAIEWRNWNQRLKMSKQEMRDEMRDATGNPHIKAKVRQIQRAMRRRRVKADMSRASVIITNPTHYAVALEFSFETMSAPIVLAKGRDLLAAEIREEARWAGVPIIENPPLARSLYKMVEPGQSIPFELYAAVAGILAYLYRQRMEERMRRQREADRRIQQAGLLGGFVAQGTTRLDVIHSVGGGM